MTEPKDHGIFPAALVVAFLVMLGWVLWTEYRISGLEIRMNLAEAAQHWQEEPPK